MASKSATSCNSQRLTHFIQANSGPNTNGCQVSRVVLSCDASSISRPQFFITTSKADFLDGKHVVFGKVIDGMLTLRKIENVPTGPNNRPKLVVKITGAPLFFRCPGCLPIPCQNVARCNSALLLFFPRLNSGLMYQYKIQS